MKRSLLLLLIVALAASGCAMFKAKEEKPAEVLAQEGAAAFKDQSYREAIEAFQKLKDLITVER